MTVMVDWALKTNLLPSFLPSFLPSQARVRMSCLPDLSLTPVDTLMDSYTSVDIMTDMGGLLPVGQSHSGPGSDSLVCLLHMFMFFMERVTSTGIMIDRR